MGALSREARESISSSSTKPPNRNQGHGPYNQQSQSSPSQSSPTVQTTPTASLFLERLARSMIEAINTRYFEQHPSSRHLSPDLQSYPHYRSPTAGITPHFDAIRHLLTTYPAYQLQVTDVKAHVNLRAGYADVYVKLGVTGLPPGVLRNCVQVMEFRLQGGVWMCVKVTVIRGMVHDRNVEDDGEEDDDVDDDDDDDDDDDE